MMRVDRARARPTRAQRAPTLRDLSLDAPRGRARRDPGPQRRGQVDASALRVRARRVRRGLDRGRRARASRAARDPAPLLGKVGLVFQSLELFPHLRVLDNCVLAPVRARGSRVRRGARARERTCCATSTSPTRSACSRRALGRAAAARRDRARADGRAGGAALRRAHERARSRAQARGAAHDRARRRARRHHAARRHPRRGARDRPHALGVRARVEDRCRPNGR